MSSPESFKVLTGPRGGDLNRAVQEPERRRAEFRGETLDENVLGLHRFEDSSNQGLKNEQPWHRMAAMLMLAGKSNKEIAELADCHVQGISILRGQRWFQELLAHLAAQTNKAAMGLLQGEAVASVEMIVAMRDDIDAPKRVRLSAAQTILEHACGKPTQRVLSITAHTSYASASEEMADIQQQLEALRQAESGETSSLPVQPTEKG